MALGALIRNLRRQAGLTLTQLAERVPMSPSALSRTELGAQGPPPDEAIEAIASSLGVDAEDLLRAAGRRPGSQDFEETVLVRLDQLHRELRQMQADLRAVKEAVTGRKPKT
ncbi:MAG: helix-turn-helix domain-containing protein [Actinobacteria bacterium]|nr:helix-turn-helix domain-containing protein [Actinomycetota bacterium]